MTTDGADLGPARTPLYGFQGARREWAQRVGHAARALAGDTRTAALRSELITTLDEVAGAVSTATRFEDVLDVVVESAKRVVDAEKAAIVLTDHHHELLDFDTLVVRGRRDQHLQDWWADRLEPLAQRAFSQARPFEEEHPEEGATILVSPIQVKDRTLGLIAVINSNDHRIDAEHVQALRILSAFAAGSIENAQLAEQSRYVLLASERDRIAREMHDGVVQSLFSISLGLELCKKKVTRDPVAVIERLEQLQEQLNVSMAELRRFIYDLRPMKLTEFGLVGAVDYWIKEITAGRDVQGRMRVEGDVPNLTPSEEACLYRVAKESIANVMRHAGASAFEVVIDFEPGMGAVTISDDGRGFDVDTVLIGGTQGLGLKSIRDRVAREGGTLSIDSVRGSGTVLRASLPVGGGSR